MGLLYGRAGRLTAKNGDFRTGQDVDETTPAFAVVPRSRRCSNIRELRRKLGAGYTEVPIVGPAGTCY